MIIAFLIMGLIKGQSNETLVKNSGRSLASFIGQFIPNSDFLKPSGSNSTYSNDTYSIRQPIKQESDDLDTNNPSSKVVEIYSHFNE